jgi:hypothetical protein
LEEAGGRGEEAGLVGLAGEALLDVGADVGVKAGPIKVAGEAVNGLPDTEVAGDGDVVGFLKKGGTE